ncbi:cysteine desulfurase [Candidatus Babeliales bacterium]|nr:cysteine desulfurase [Candidatus Babeliales bacterium]MCF7899221.1 cysteine desulfurase [Candidatus Babeliales bacterium]
MKNLINNNNFEKLKQNFLIFKNNKNLIYLDNAATSQKPDIVIKSLVDFYEKHNSNIHRSIYDLGEVATDLYENARQAIANFINAKYEEIVFTSGTTEGINFVADSWGKENIFSGDQILITQVEHHANFLPWQRLAQEKGAELKFLNLDKSNFLLKNLSQEDLDKLINSKTKIVALTLDSNVLGNIWPDDLLERIIEKAHSVGAKVLLDAAQAVAHKKIDVEILKPDFLVFSGHKMFGPTGIGVLYIKKDLHKNLRPYQLGGSMVYSVFCDKPAIYRDAPNKFEAGTQPIAQAIGLKSAIDFTNQNINFDELKKYEASLTSYLIDKLNLIPECQILGNIDMLKKEGHLVTFYIKNIHAHDLSAFLSKNNIATRSGNHCAQPLFELLSVESSLRVSFSFYNTHEDVDLFLDALKEAIIFFEKN